MERIDFLKNSLLAVMEELTKRFSSTDTPGVAFHPVVDEKNGHFQLMAVGWMGNDRVFNIFFEADIVNDKIWIQEDNTEESIAVLLEEKGVSKKDIVLGYFPEYHRRHMEYAVA